MRGSPGGGLLVGVVGDVPDPAVAESAHDGGPCGDTFFESVCGSHRVGAALGGVTFGSGPVHASQNSILLPYGSRVWEPKRPSRAKVRTPGGLADFGVGRGCGGAGSGGVPDIGVSKLRLAPRNQGDALHRAVKGVPYVFQAKTLALGGSGGYLRGRKDFRAAGWCYNPDGELFGPVPSRAGPSGFWGEYFPGFVVWSAKRVWWRFMRRSRAVSVSDSRQVLASVAIVSTVRAASLPPASTEISAMAASSTTLTLGHTLGMVAVFLDQHGNHMLQTPTLDAAPAWTNTTPAVAAITPGAYSCAAVPVAAGTDTITLTVVSGGKTFTATNDVTVSGAAQVLTSVAIASTVT